MESTTSDGNNSFVTSGNGNHTNQGRLMKFDRQLTGLDLRGSNYRKVLNQVAPTLEGLFNLERKVSGKVTMRAIVLISEELGLPAKTTCEFLECLGKLPVGTWERSRIKSNQINEAKEMTWRNGMGLATANKLFERYGVAIVQDPNTKIYTATLGDKTIQHTSVTAIAETILDKWFVLVEPSGAIGYNLNEFLEQSTRASNKQEENNARQN
jgi:hypothetical protein